MHRPILVRMTMRRSRRTLAQRGLNLLAGLALLAGAPAGAGPASAPAAASAFYGAKFEKRPTVAAMTVIGRAMFFDKQLSASGRLACANCHSPAHFFGPPNGLAVQRGGGDGRQSGTRAVPTLMYTQNIPSFTEHFFDDDGNDSVDQGPAGGRTWDGRAQSAHDQARLPLLSPLEMANASPLAVVEKARAAAYAAQLREAFGAHVLDDPALAFTALLMSLETFQQSPAEFYPYSSKYDAYLRRQIELSPQEARGLAAFVDPGKGNCARCHPNGIREGAFPQFTDFGFAAIGVPRNRSIPANAARHYYDLGLCGPLRTDLAAKTEYCGMFRAPTLRNVATRTVFFHNGQVHSLADAVRFYAERDTQPQKWYPKTRTGIDLYDDLPAPYKKNLDVEAPFDRQRGDPAPLDAADIADIVAFLSTLTDGYPQTPTPRPQTHGAR
jgi:cytochrome c peroxidase